jgi:hypothetical protein
MSSLSFPENLLMIQGLAPTVGAGAAVTSIPISLKNVQKLWTCCHINTASTSAAVAIVPQTDTLVAFGSAAVLINTVPIWVNADSATSDLWTRATDAVNYTTVADALSKLVVFEIDPSSFRSDATNLARTEYCFRISFTQVDASDLVAVTYVIQPRYISKSDTRTYILD